MPWYLWLTIGFAIGAWWEYLYSRFVRNRHRWTSTPSLPP